MAIIKIRNAAIDLDAAEIPNLPASKITSGTFVDARIADLAASKLTGTIATARLGSGTASGTTFLAGDQTYKTAATEFNDDKLVNDISTLALHQATNNNSAKYNLTNSNVDVYQDSSAIANLVNCSRDNTGEYIATASQPNIATTVNMGSNNIGRTANGTALTIGSNGNVDISGLSINSESSPTSADTYGVKIDLGSAKTLATPLRWFPNGKRYKSQGGGSNDYNAGIIEINFGSSDGSGWQFGSGGVTPTVNWSGNFTEWSNKNLIYNQNFTSPDEGFYHSSGTASTGSDYIQYSWSGTATGRYVYISMNPTNGVYNGFTMTDANGNLFAPISNAAGNYESTAQTANTSVNKISAVVTYTNASGTNTLNTDIILQVSADNGSNWSNATLTSAGTFSTGVLQAVTNDINVTAGTQLKYKIFFANQASGSKVARINGVSLSY